MRTVVTYLDKDNKQVNKEEAWTVVTRVYNDAGNLQRTGFTVGEAQKKANAGPSVGLCLMETDTGKKNTFSKTVVKAGREAPCDLIITIPEKKKIEKVHAMFEYRENRWYVMNLAKRGLSVNGEQLKENERRPIHAGDCITFAGKKEYRLESL